MAYCCASAYILAAAIFIVIAVISISIFYGYVSILCFVIAFPLGVAGSYLFVALCSYRHRIDFSLKVLQTAASILVKVPSAAALSYVTLGIQALWITCWLLLLRRSLEAPVYVIGFLFFRFVSATRFTTTLEYYRSQSFNGQSSMDLSSDQMCAAHNLFRRRCILVFQLPRAKR